MFIDILRKFPLKREKAAMERWLSTGKSMLRQAARTAATAGAAAILCFRAIPTCPL